EEKIVGDHAGEGVGVAPREGVEKPLHDRGVRPHGRVVSHCGGTPAQWYVAGRTPDIVDRAAQPRTPPVVVIGASAGGVEALLKLVGGLTDELGAAVVIVLHLPATGRSVLPDILRRSGRLPVVAAGHGQALVANCIAVAPPDHHVLVVDGRLFLDRGPRENGCRPAADPLFRSAARARASDVIGVVLSGSLDDGVSGLRAIKEAGGIAVVQDPKDALTPS